MSFLQPIIQEIAVLGDKGLLVKKSEDAVYNGKVYLLGVAGDIPGITDLMKHQGHMAYYGCRICTARGVRPIESSGMYFTCNGCLRTMDELINGDAVRIHNVLLIN
jgi:hypothetical protein